MCSDSWLWPEGDAFKATVRVPWVRRRWNSHGRQCWNKYLLTFCILELIPRVKIFCKNISVQQWNKSRETLQAVISAQTGILPGSPANNKPNSTVLLQIGSVVCEMVPFTETWSWVNPYMVAGGVLMLWDAVTPVSTCRGCEILIELPVLLRLPCSHLLYPYCAATKTNKLHHPGAKGQVRLLEAVSHAVFGTPVEKSLVFIRNFHQSPTAWPERVVFPHKGNWKGIF